MMTSGFDLSGKTILEPSAGSGNIVDFVKKLGAEVIACERHKDLQMIVAQKCRLIKSDFFDVTSEEISHIDFIIMNPPFSNADKHIQHAWDIAPEGCNIIALSNAETILNRWNSSRTKLGKLIEDNGSWRNIGDAFSTADRTTNIDIALISMFKPKSGDSEFEDYFFDMNEEQEEAVSGSGIMKHNDIREIVNRYVAAVKMFDSVIEVSNQINGIIGPISDGLGITFGAQASRDNRYTVITRDVFKKELQKSAWRSVFNKMNMQKYVTKGVMSDINKFVEQQQQIPFTMTNIYKMLEIIFGTHSGRMDKVLVEVFDKICSLSADNSEAGEKWKTNSNYKINRRFIMNWMVEVGWSGQMNLRYARMDELDDIVKALCFITGKNYEDQISLYSFLNYSHRIKCDGRFFDGYDNYGNRNDKDKLIRRVEALKEAGRNAELVITDTSFGQWIEWGFFRIRGYKKGTMHFEFVDENVWMEFNRRVAKIKGWAIPQKTNSKTKGTERQRKAGVDLFNFSHQ